MISVKLEIFIITMKIFRQNHSPGSCDEDNEDFQTCQTFCWAAVSDLHPEPGLQRTRSPPPPHSRQLTHCKTVWVFVRENIKERLLDCVHDIFCGEGRIAVDISGQFLVFPDDPHHGGLRAPASVNSWQGEDRGLQEATLDDHLLSWSEVCVLSWEYSSSPSHFPLW